jgi:hypothetical protein
MGRARQMKKSIFDLLQQGKFFLRLNEMMNLTVHTVNAQAYGLKKRELFSWFS